MSPTGRPGVHRRSPPLHMAVTASGDRAIDVRWAVWRLALEAATATMLAELEAAGVPAILLKGPVTARRLYPGEFRPCVDIDVLVPPHGVPAARDWLRRNGFHAISTGSWVFRRPGEGMTIDLHRRLPETSTTPEQGWQLLARHTVAFELHGRSVRALDEAAHACHLAIHAVQTGNRKPKPRADLDRAVASMPLRTWVGALTVARELGAEPALLAALRCHAADGDRVADALGLPHRVPSLLRLCAADASAASEMLRRFRPMSWGERIHQLRLWVAPTPTQVAARLAQPNTPDWLPGRFPLWLRYLALRAYQLAAITRALVAARRTGTRPPAR